MTPADLARALAAAPWWEWDQWNMARHGTVDMPRDPEWIDLSDDATAGVLVGMLEATGRLSCIRHDPSRPYAHTIELRHPWDLHVGATLAEAAGRALLACRS